MLEAMIRPVRLVCLALVLVVLMRAAGGAQAGQLPAVLSDEEFARMISGFSEAGGSFDSDNFVSNEANFQSVIPALLERTGTGGVYIGVGPEQNFTYIAALQPRISFIVDIRRQNMLQLLMYKALFELSSDRADFLARLFSRARPRDLDSTMSVSELIAPYEPVRADERLFQQTLQAVTDRLVHTRQLALTDDDRGTIAYVLKAFADKGSQITYVNPGSPNAKQPTFAQLMAATDSTGQLRSFLASEGHFRIVQELQRRNLVVPLVGDFAGNQTLRRIGEYLKQHDAAVTVFYTSNVERYLYGSPRRPVEDWKRFYANLSALPLTDRSTFIRAGSSVDQSILGPIRAVVDEFARGGLKAFGDVLATSK
jgi:hypothetical protein